MDKIKKAFQSMSLKKSLVLLTVSCLGLVSVLSVITILTCSSFQQKILDTRPIIVTNYVIGDTETENNVNVVPQEYIHGKLSKENQIYYYFVTSLMVILPIIYITAASILIAKLYYKLKLQTPLENLNSGIYHISKQDLDFQIQYTSDDELGKLCRTFENMKNELYKNNCKMWDMLQERKALTASVSHDLRTPITVLNGYLDYLDKSVEKKSLTDEVLQTTIKNMADAVKRLERYVDCVKDIQKIEDIEIKKEFWNLKVFISVMTTDFEMIARQHNKHFEIHDFSNSLLIETDKDMLSKVLENVFDNALRFSVDKIILTIEETADYFCITIQDDGVGFHLEELHLATSAFYSSSVNCGKFGIGLTICKILCEKLGGVLTLENNTYHGAKVGIKIKK